MIIKTLVENTSISEGFKNEHGLSIYVETKSHKLLFDMGASELFIENAKKLNVDLSEVDLAVISHGHFDHGGGLKAFLNLNDKAKIYLNKHSFNRHYANRPNGVKKYIGLDESLVSSRRFMYVGDYMRIDDELELFSNIKGKRLYPSGNQDLFIKHHNQYLHDDFIHEQNLLVTEDGNSVLLAGCSHNGIVNIIEHVSTQKKLLPNHVIGGFHLYSPSANKCEDPIKVDEIGEYLKNTGSMYYTCHCTGIESYNRLKKILGRNIEYLSAGSILEI